MKCSAIICLSEGKEEERQSVEVREAIVSRVGHSFVATGTYNVDCYLCL